MRAAAGRLVGDGPQLVELGPDERVEFEREFLQQFQNLDESARSFMRFKFVIPDASFSSTSFGSVR